MSRLQQWMTKLGRPAVAPLIGAPGAALTSTTLRQNLSDEEAHTESIRAVHARWPSDIVLPMMDLSIEAGALGLAVRFSDHEPPTVQEHPVKEKADLDRFRAVDVLSDRRLRSVLRTLANLSSLDDAMLCAYAVGPFTLAGLLMGANEIAMATIRKPDLVHATLQFAARIAETYAAECLVAGAQGVLLLEPTAALLSPTAFEEFSGRYIARLTEQLDAMCMLHVCGQTTPLLDAMCATGVDGLSLDAPVDFPRVIDRIPVSMTLIGNIDPVRVLRAGDPGAVRAEVRCLRAGMARHENFILSTGCDLPLETPPETIDAFFDAARAELAA